MTTRKDDKIREILERYGEPWDASTVWRVQGVAVLYHAVLERIAAKAGIKYGEPKIIRAERDECVILGTAWTINEDGEVVDEVWTFGEALIGVNYRVSGKQSAYVYSMTEKRMKDRLVLKLIGITDEALDETSAREREEDERQDALRAQYAQGKRPRSTDEAIERMSPSKQIKVGMITSLYKISGPKVDIWLRKPEVKSDMARMDEVDRLDVERFAQERAEIE